MALLYQAELRPSKLDLIAAWAPTQPWFVGDADAGFVSVASFRFDDPQGEVGIETLLVRSGDGPILQVALTYRGSPLPGGDAWLIGTMDHSVLGPRWVYDGAGDPAYLAAVAAAALTGASQAEQFIDIDGQRVVREPTALVRGSGTPGAVTPGLPAMDTVSTRHEHGVTVVNAGALRLVVARVLSDGASVGLLAVEEPANAVSSAVLSGTWTGQAVPQPLVLVQVRPA
jgi:hypothetical protein